MKYGEISHFSHPHHTLKFDYAEAPFKCDGCKEVGIGSSYKCSSGASCNFDLHKHCAVPSPTITHQFYTKCSFQFLSRPPGPEARYCNACEKVVSGFLYHCNLCGFDLHPCCAKLPMVLDDGEIKLHLYRKVSAPCQRCGRKGRSWSYRSSCKKYNLHVACVKEMLVENWQEMYADHEYDDNRQVPNLKATLGTHSKSKGKARKGCEMAGLALQFVVSALLGDPTTLIAGLVGTLMSRSCESRTTLTAKLILLNGQLQEFAWPVKVSFLSQQNTNCFICSSDEMEIGRFLAAMDGDEVLQPGEIYFELPMAWRKQTMQVEDMAVLACKASAVLVRSDGDGDANRTVVNCCCCGSRKVEPLMLFSERPLLVANGRVAGREGRAGGLLRQRFVGELNAIAEE